MNVFYLKYRDTFPVLEVVLLNPDGSIHDLTGSTAWKLHVLLSDGGVVTRDMTVFGFPAAGTVRYQWLSTDWASIPIGPTLPLRSGQREHRMEYEILGPGSSRLTFPNGGESAEESYDILRVWSDIGQG
jgi:hypothetical protein